MWLPWPVTLWESPRWPPAQSTGVLLRPDLHVPSLGPQSGGLSALVIFGLGCKSSPPLPIPQTRDLQKRGPKEQAHPPLQPAQPGPEATCGPGLGVGWFSVLGKSNIFSHLHPLSPDLEGLQLLSVSSGRARRTLGAWASADGFPLPSGHPGGERPSFRRRGRGEPVHSRCPAPELSEGESPLCLDGELHPLFLHKNYV